VGSKSTDLADGYSSNVGVLPERFAAIDIAQVNFHRGQPYGSNGIPQSDAGVGVGARVDEDAGVLLASPVNGIDQHPLMVRLQDLQLCPKNFCLLVERPIDLF
jgi:hypothetical protein